MPRLGQPRAGSYAPLVLGACRFVCLVAVGLGLWLFADLYFRIDLPGAGWLLHQAFRAASVGVRWLEDDVEGSRLQGIAALGLIAALAVAVPWKPSLWPRRVLALPLVVAQLAFLAVAGLMERSLLLGIVVGAAVGIRSQAPEPAAEGLDWRRSAVGVISAGLAVFYLVEIFAVRSEGYSLVDWVDSLMRDGLPLTWIFVACTAVLGARAAQGLGRGSWCALPGLAAAGLAALLLDRGLPLVSGAVTAAAGSLVLAAAWSKQVAAPRGRAWDPATWPTRLAPAVLIAALLIGHAYAARIFHCVGVDEHTALTRVAEPGEVFRLALGRDGAVLALALREERRIGRMELGVEDAPLTFAAPGVLPAPPPEWGDFPPGSTLASIEELVYAEGADRFYGTALGGHPDFNSLPSSPPNWMRTLIFELPGDASSVLGFEGDRDMCWVGALAWHEADERLYVGCEYEPRVLRFDPAAGRIEASVQDERLGDVAALAFDPRPGSDRMFAVSFWNTRTVTELSRSELRVRRARAIGGSHYDLAFEPSSDRLFVSSYYGSRVRILRGEDLEPVGRIATGLGARPLAVDVQRGLVLAASVYDGMLRVCESGTGDVLEALHVGGHVKDVVVDEAAEVAWLASRCGLFRVDLAALVGSSD